MCGIAGVWDLHWRLGAGVGQQRTQVMTDSMHHRGPDGEGQWSDPSIGLVLGHRRLSIVDLSAAGSQPMQSADGRWVISYNGEIYDHVAVRADLEAAGVRFRGHSDTEVLVEAIAMWGIDRTIRRVDGMFAIALFDRTRRELHLIRDRFGEKPVAYGTIDGVFVFASDTRALRTAFPGRLELDPNALNAFLRYRAVPAPLSIHLGISKVRPGGWVTVDETGNTHERRWFDPWDEARRLANSRLDLSVAEATDMMEATLQRSVAQRLEADVSVGVFLSGGVDSTLVAALASTASKHPVQTFTVGFTDAAFDESRFARPVAEHLGTSHAELILTPEAAMESIGRAIAAYDEPFADSSQLPTLLVSELAKQHVTVALGGDGGDELFGGYNRHRWIASMWPRIERVPVRARSYGASALDAMPLRLIEQGAALIPLRHRPRQLALKTSKIAATLNSTGPEDLWLRLVSHWQDPLSLTGRGDDWAPEMDFTRLSLADAAGIADVAHYLPTDILTKVDRASMATSLEVRAPFLGRDVAHLAWSIPSGARMSGESSKPLLRSILRRHVPEPLWNRPKSGFGIPLGDWITGPMIDWTEDRLAHLATSLPWLRSEAIDHAWEQAKKHPDGGAPYLVWDLVALSEWTSGP